MGDPLLVFTMAKLSIKLKSSLKWLVTTWVSFPSHTSQLNMEGLVLVPHTLRDSSLSSKKKVHLLQRQIKISTKKKKKKKKKCFLKKTKKKSQQKKKKKKKKS